MAPHTFTRKPLLIAAASVGLAIVFAAFTCCVSASSMFDALGFVATGGFAFAMTWNSLPGQRTLKTNTLRNVLLSTNVLRYGKGVVDASSSYDGKNTSLEDELRAGTIMARITASKLWVPCKRTTVDGTAGSVEAAVVVDSRAFKAGDLITIGTDDVTITSVDYDTETISWSGAVTVADTEAVFARGALAGAETARGILNETIKLKDEDATWRDKTFSQLIIVGAVDDTQVLGDLTAIRTASNELEQIQFGLESGQN